MTTSPTLTLTSQKVQEGHLLKNRELVLLIDGQRYDEYLSHDTRVHCLEQAITDFDTELQTAAQQFRDHPYGAYLWLYLPDFIRNEEIVGLFRLMYFKAIIVYLIENEKINTIQIKTPINKYLKSLFLELNLSLVFNRHVLFKNCIYNILQNVKRLVKDAKFNIGCLFSRRNKLFEGVLVDTSPRLNKNRYDNLKSVVDIFEGKVKYYSGDQIPVSGASKNQTVVFKMELTLTILIQAFIKSFRISKFISHNKNTIPLGIYHSIKGKMNMLFYWDLVIAQACMARYLDKSNIKTIVQVSTFTKPIYRSLVSEARRRNIPFVQVASRTLMRHRCSERLLPCDVGGYNQTAIPDWFIVKDNYSAKVFDPFPELKHRVFTGGRFKSRQIEISNQDKPVAILLMFNHRKDLSYKLLAEVKKSGAHNLTKTIIVRCHPSFVFPDGELKQTFPDNELIDITGKDYNALSNYRTICISGPTTGTLDAIQHGTIVLWVPYIWDDGILMDDIMRDLGVICLCINDIQFYARLFINEPVRFSEQYDSDLVALKKWFLSDTSVSGQIRGVAANKN
jgi:hypothetical protein